MTASSARPISRARLARANSRAWADIRGGSARENAQIIRDILKVGDALVGWPIAVLLSPYTVPHDSPIARIKTIVRLVNLMAKDLSAFTSGEKFSDDVTIIALKRH